MNAVHMNMQDIDGNTALHTAVSMYHTDAARALLRRRAVDANLRNVAGKTALTIARELDPPAPDLLQLLLSATLERTTISQQPQRQQQ
jgi:ankyrin repeat protein